MLARVDRIHREFFRPAGAGSQLSTWAPPVDVLETRGEVLVLIALPGVAPADAKVAIDGSDLVVAGTRSLPQEWRTAAFHRLELPQGRFERRVPLPAGRYRDVGLSSVDGCLLITLKKAEVSRG